MTTRARVIVLERDFGVMKIREVALPEPGPRQVLLQVYSAGVGHAQLHQVLNPEADLPLLGTNR